MSLDYDEWTERIAKAPDSSRRAQIFDEWAATHDADAAAVGHSNHVVAAALVTRHISITEGAILDAGAGTGALGEILHLLGYPQLVAIDFSEGMLAQARKRNVYSELKRCALGETLPYADATFAAVLSFGVLVEPLASPNSLDELVRVTQPGGRLIFSVGGKPWNTGGFKEKAATLESAGVWEEIEVVGPYRPTPLSRTRHSITNSAFVFRRISGTGAKR